MKKKTILYVSVAIIIGLLAPYVWILSLIGVISVPYSISKAEFRKELKSIPYESDASNLVYDLSGTIYTKDKKINMIRYCEKQKNLVSYEDALCVYQDKVCFVCTTANEEWAIASVDLNTKEFKAYCALPNQGLSTGEQIYHRACNSGKYSERNGFVYGEKIVLNNKYSVLSFDIKTEECQTCPYEEYAFPEETIYAEFISSQKILLHMDENVLTCTPETLSENNPAMKQLYSLQNEEIPHSDLKRLDSFYYEKSIQQIGEEIYSANRILTSRGDVFFILFKLDENTNQWKYAKAIFQGYYEEDTISLITEIS